MWNKSWPTATMNRRHLLILSQKNAEDVQRVEANRKGVSTDQDLKMTFRWPSNQASLVWTKDHVQIFHRMNQLTTFCVFRCALKIG